MLKAMLETTLDATKSLILLSGNTQKLERGILRRSKLQSADRKRDFRPVVLPRIRHFVNFKAEATCVMRAR
jgi:hypothetical protein